LQQLVVCFGLGLADLTGHAAVLVIGLAMSLSEAQLGPWSLAKIQGGTVMASISQTASAAPANDALHLLSAIVEGRASVEDISAELKRKGIDSVEAVLTMLSNGMKEHTARQKDAKKPISLEILRNKPSAEATSEIVHRAPTIPFRLNGVLYDPKDIVRFNGKELHFIQVANGEQILVIDDRELLTNWLQFSYISAMARAKIPNRNPRTAQDAYDRGFDYFENSGYRNDSLTLEPGWGYYDLTQVSKGFLGLGDWNDEISSVSSRSGDCDPVEYPRYGVFCATVLCDDIHWEGQTLSIFYAADDLSVFGWNDRTSSMFVVS
jgi:hypothetical protein